MPVPLFSSSLDAASLAGYLERLVANYVPDGREPAYPLRPIVEEALERVEHSFSHIHRKYYEQDGRVEFDHLNGDHLASFLYLAANSAFTRTGDTILPTKLFAVNKAMHGLDLYFSVTLPSIFLLVHPVGSVIGNAEYGDYLAIYQNCTIGADKGRYPTFGTGTILYARSTVLGDSHIGDDVIFAANSMVVNTDVPPQSLVVGQFPQHRVLPSEQTARERLFGG